MTTVCVPYRGPSRIDPTQRIVAVLGSIGPRPSANGKTGALAKLWIFVVDEPPHKAWKSGADTAVCGSCPLRPAAGGEVKCHVTTHQARFALRVWKSARNCRTSLARAVQALRESGRGLRVGEYGNPSALPLEVVQALVGAVSGRLWGTAYEHEWRSSQADGLQGLAMASVESLVTESVDQVQSARRGEPRPGAPN